jgi:alanine racemase
MGKTGVKIKNTSYISVDVKAVKYNHDFFKKLVVDKCEVAMVMKSDSMGLGVEQMAKIFYNNGCKNFFVAYPYEGALIRKVLKDENVNIYIFVGFFEDQKAYFKKYNLIPILNSVYELMAFKNFCKKEKNNYQCGVKVDTGFSRHGLTMDEMEQFKTVINSLNTKLIISHLACSDEKNHPKNTEQLNNFLKIKEIFGNRYKYSLAATCGCFLGEKYHFDMVRIGFGFLCNKASKKLKNAVGVYAKILQVKIIKKGDIVGYGASFTAEKDMKIAILGVGYSHGLFKNYQYSAWINDQKCDFIGMISMEYSTIDVSDVYDKYLQIGSFVELVGPHLSLGDMAEKIHTNPSNVLTNLGKLEKLYVNMGEN